MRKRGRPAPVNVWDAPRPAVPLNPQECAVVIGACQYHSHDRWYWELKGSSGDLAETLLRRAGRMAALGRQLTPLATWDLVGHSEMWLLRRVHGMLLENAWRPAPPEARGFLALYPQLAIREGMAEVRGWMARGQGVHLDWVREPCPPAEDDAPAIGPGETP